MFHHPKSIVLLYFGEIIIFLYLEIFCGEGEEQYFYDNVTRTGYSFNDHMGVHFSEDYCRVYNKKVAKIPKLSKL